jgi:hypothetical protein
LAGLFAGEDRGGEAAEFVVNERKELVGAGAIAGVDLSKDARYFVHSASG